MRGAATVAAEYNVDPDRIYLSGISMGGGGAWVALTHFEGGLAAGVPMAGPSYSTIDHEQAVDVPIWNFHSRDDSAVPVSRSRINCNAVYAAAGLPAPNYPSSGPDFFYEAGRLRLTEFDGKRHGIVSDAMGMGQTETWAWLLSQVNDRSRPREGETIRFDFGASTASTYAGNVWNSTFSGLERGTDVALAFTRTEDDRGTGVSVQPIDTFDGVTSSGSSSSFLPSSIAGDGWTVGSNAGHGAALDQAGVLRITSLTPGAPYRVEVFGSWNSSDGGLGRVARYTIGNAWRDLDLVGNTSETAVFETVYADASGALALGVGVSPDSTARWASINAAWITALEFVEPPACAGDVNASGGTDVADFAILVGNFGMASGAGVEHGDLNADGGVDTLDFAIFASDFGCSID
jgi:dienelactone hydrolase